MLRITSYLWSPVSLLIVLVILFTLATAAEAGPLAKRRAARNASCSSAQATASCATASASTPNCSSAIPQVSSIVSGDSVAVKYGPNTYTGTVSKVLADGTLYVFLPQFGFTIVRDVGSVKQK